MNTAPLCVSGFARLATIMKEFEFEVPKSGAKCIASQEARICKIFWIYKHPITFPDPHLSATALIEFSL
jgi:hypothetical protein